MAFDDTGSADNLGGSLGEHEEISHDYFVRALDANNVLMLSTEDKDQDLLNISNEIFQSGTMNKTQAMAIEAIEAGILPKGYPVNSYSEIKTRTNVDVTLRALSENRYALFMATCQKEMESLRDIIGKVKLMAENSASQMETPLFEKVLKDSWDRFTRLDYYTSRENNEKSTPEAKEFVAKFSGKLVDKLTPVYQQQYSAFLNNVYSDPKINSIIDSAIDDVSTYIGGTQYRLKAFADIVGSITETNTALIRGLGQIDIEFAALRKIRETYGLDIPERVLMAEYFVNSVTTSDKKPVLDLGDTVRQFLSADNLQDLVPSSYQFTSINFDGLMRQLDAAEQALGSITKSVFDADAQSNDRIDYSIRRCLGRMFDDAIIMALFLVVVTRLVREAKAMALGSKAAFSNLMDERGPGTDGAFDLWKWDLWRERMIAEADAEREAKNKAVQPESAE